MNIGERLVKARKAKGLSQEAVANELNVSRQSVSLWETDQTMPTVDNLMALSALYDVSVSYLLGQEESINTTIVGNNNSVNIDSKRQEEERYVQEQLRRREEQLAREEQFEREKEQRELERQRKKEEFEKKEYKKNLVFATIALVLVVLNPDRGFITVLLAAAACIATHLARQKQKNKIVDFMFFASIFYLIVGVLDIMVIDIITDFAGILMDR